VEYKLESSTRYKKEYVSIHENCQFWDGNICFKLDSVHGITGNKIYNIKVSDTAVISLD
jgi:hypothetical protein